MNASNASLSTLPNDCWSIVINNLALRNTLACCEVCKCMRTDIHAILRSVHTMEESINAKGVDFIIKHFDSLPVPPVITATGSAIEKATIVDTEMLRKLIDRWPSHLTLNWHLSPPNVITNFINSLKPAKFRAITHLTIIVTPNLYQTVFTLPYLDLDQLALYCHNTDVSAVMARLRLRDWDVKDLFVQGDIHSTVDAILHLPFVHQHLAILNTSTTLRPSCVYAPAAYGVEEMTRFLCNQNLETVALCGMLPICCEDCSAANDFCRGVYSANLSKPGGLWHLDVASASMIETLTWRGISVATGIFESERSQIDELQIRYPGMIIVHASV